MSRKGALLIIAAIVLIAVVAGIVKLQGTKRQHASDGAAGTAQRPFKTAVVELTFRSKSLHEGEGYLSDTGRGTEYIDAAGGRRRQDFERTITAMRQLTTTEGLTLIFDGTKLYIVTSKNGKRAGRVADLREGYDNTVWKDAAAEELRVPGATVSEEEFLGRPCKVYSISPGKTVQKWWVWNGITLRSETHFEDATTVQDITEEAVRVEEDVEIDPALFSPPPDVTFEPAQLSVAEQDHHKPAPWVRYRPDVMFGIYF